MASKPPKRKVNPLMSQKEARQLLMTGDPDEIYERLPWDAPICEEEITMWYPRFCAYRDLEPSKRTLLEAKTQYLLDKPDNEDDSDKHEETQITISSTVTNWSQYSRLYLWNERIQAKSIYLNAKTQEHFTELTRTEFEKQHAILKKLQNRTTELLDSGIVLDNQNAVVVAATLKAFTALHGAPERQSKADKQEKHSEQAPQIIVNMPSVIATPRIADKVIDVTPEK